MPQVQEFFRRAELKLFTKTSQKREVTEVQTGEIGLVPTVMDKTNMDWAKDIPCRNVIIYGYCRKEQEGCPFKHENQQSTGQTTTVAMKVSSSSDITTLSSGHPGPSPSTPTPKFNAKVSASFTPMSAKGTGATALGLESEPAGTAASDVHSTGLSTTLQLPSLSSGGSFGAPAYNPYAAESFTPGSSAGLNLNDLAIHDESNGTLRVSRDAEGTLPVHLEEQPLSGTSHLALKYPTIYPPPHSLLQYHLYAPDPPPHLKISLKPNERTPESLFIPNDLREELVKRNLASLQVFPLGGATPTIVQDYFGLVSLDFNKSSGTRDSFMGHKNSLYKVFSNVDGKLYLLRRIHDVKGIDQVSISSTYQAWSKVSSANVVKLRDLFLTTKFGDSSLCAVYDYYPLGKSLYDAHFASFPLTPITQEYLWTYLVQLTNGMKAVHSNNLAVGSLNWDKVIVTGSPGRIKISGCGVVNVLRYNEHHDLYAEQQKDYKSLGELLRDLASKIGPHKENSVEELVVEEGFKNVLNYLLDENNRKDIGSLTMLFYDKLFSCVDSCLTYTEYTEGVLSRELENGRLFRLMCKLNCIYGRMESRIDVNWSESGSKFPIVLFYDFVFHQVDASGKNILDLTHVLRCLNKLDAGVSEKIVLATPDEMNCIIISYKELKDLIDYSFRSLTQ